MTRAPVPPQEGAPKVDLHKLEGLISEARDLMSGLPDAIDEVRTLHNTESAAFAIAIATSTFRSLVEACELVEGFFDQAPTADAGKADVPGFAGSDRPRPPERETRIAAATVLHGHAVQKIRGGAVIHGRPNGDALLGIVVGPLPVNDADGDVLVQTAGPCEGHVDGPVLRGQLLTVSRRGGLVRAEPKRGKAVHCIAVALEDSGGGEKGLCFPAKRDPAARALSPSKQAGASPGGQGAWRSH